ncbi:Gfo/Idh/MocA family protein [Arundinibacter roseus]|uniref:Gfo/Idh/MocA family oxidoreductase n=1 Tax=Arundinibacter roseus TaxID=2070510 RepID=A0A4V2X9N0_9BACT|nr:Gfo/Idh/MocA family oxidoreductase [Arundinibacter roseus]TDB64465.1 Gfo/Idh/MocA family oxidoreductase [Arundinibacter roseus]
MNRRNFIQQSTLATAAFSSLPLFSALKRAAPYRTALIGSGWWGMNILRCAVQSGESKVVALCDVDQNQLAKAKTALNGLTADQPKLYHDYRELLAKEKPEIVIVATPDHWHALCCIEAIKSGAHVYVEKPICHTIGEGRAMVNAARKYGKTVQVGTHRRISPHNISGMEFLKSGKAGKIGMARAFVNYGGGAGTKVANEEPPKGLDWDFWCGPAPLVPYNKTIHPRGFRQYLDFANGQLGDWGIHWLDQVLWWTEEKYPKKIYSTGGRAIRQDNTDAPDHQIAIYDFEGFTLEWQHRLFAGNNAEKTHPNQAVGVYFYGTEGTFHMGWLDGWTFYPTDSKKPIIHQDAQLNEPDQQNIQELWANFLSSIKTNQLPVCDIEIGQRSTNLALLGMLSYKLGRSIEWDGDKEIIPNDPEASKLLHRNYRGEWEYPKV